MQINALIGKKTYQKQGFLMDGTRVPLTGVVVAGNIVTQIKTQEKEGYNSVQLGVEAKKRANKAIINHVRSALDKAPKPSVDTKTASKETNEITPRYFKEVRVDDTTGFDLGSKVSISEVFAPGDIIDVTGVSKGKGWAGGVKRYNFRGGPRTHGQSDRERAPGSIGQTTTPGRVYKGKKMAGRMGSDTVTIKNLQVIEITDDGVLLIKGLVPGRINSLLMVKKVGENKKFVPLYKEQVDLPADASEALQAGDAVSKEEIVKAEESVNVVEKVAPEQTEVKVEGPAVSEEAKADEVAQEPEVVSEEVKEPEVATNEEKEDSPANA